MYGTPESNNSKFLFDLAQTTRILEKSRITAADRAVLISLIRPSYHDTGKIEGITSIDGTATHCTFCHMMQETAKADALIVCGDCYAKAMEDYREHVAPRNYIRQLILSSCLFTVAQLRALPIASRVCRFNSDGDIENATQARNYFRTAKAHSGVRFALWFKNLPAVRAAYEAEGKPKNLILIYSSCRIGESREDLFRTYPWIDYCFTVYPDHKTTDAAITAGANSCNGKKCKECGRRGFSCYYGDFPKHTNIAEYLRGVNAAKRKELVNLLNARAGL